METELNFFERHAKLIVIFACVAAATSAIFVRLAGGVPSIAIGFLRLSFAMPFLAIPALVWHRKELLGLRKKQLAGSILTGLILFMHFFTWFMSIVRTTVASAVILCTLYPIFIVLIMGLIFHEKIRLKVLIGVAIAVIGAVVVSWGDFSFAGDAKYGDILALAAAFFMAIYLIFGNKLRPGISAPVYVFLVFGSCWVFFGLGVLFSGTPITGYPIESYLAIFAMAIVCQLGAHAVFNWCLGYVSPLYIATTETGEAIFAAFLAAILFAEIPAPWQYIGGGITICGILIYNYFEALPSLRQNGRLRNRK